MLGIFMLRAEMNCIYVYFKYCLTKKIYQQVLRMEH